MSTTQQKVDLLEQELRAYESKNGGGYGGGSSMPSFSLPAISDNARRYIAVWAFASFLFLAFMVTFKPGFVQAQTVTGQMKVSRFLLFQWFLVFSLFTLIGMWVYSHCRTF